MKNIFDQYTPSEDTLKDIGKGLMAGNQQAVKLLQHIIKDGGMTHGQKNGAIMLVISHLNECEGDVYSRLSGGIPF